jgi:hypothetical protein
MTRPISTIAREIRKDWLKPNYAAVPYLEVMSELNAISDTYMHDSAEGIVTRFLSNATAWRGDTAKRIKAELKGMLA